MSFASRLARYAALVGVCLALGPAPTAAQGAGADARTATATFAGGCFWCMEPPFDALDGVISTTSGYIGGTTPSPTYEQVSSGGTGHTEAVQIVFDPAKVTYARLLEVFWRNVDAADGEGQFCDRGSQYRPAIFYHTAEQQRQAEDSKTRIRAQLGHAVPVQVAAAGTFYKAEDYHQDYYKKNPVRYKFYKWNCGREQRLDKLWGNVPTKPPGRR